MTALVLRADALTLPLPDASVDLVVTSPPYYGLRVYTDGGRTVPGQLGAEDTPGAFLERLWAATAEMVRVLKPHGSIFVNLGDTYATSARGPDGTSSTLSNGAQFRVGPGRSWRTSGVSRKSLLGLPWRYALGCIDSLGLILRAEIVWAKPNGLPESVTDRVRRAHETWFHFVRQPAYFAAVDALREPYAATTVSVRTLAGTTGARGRGERGDSHQGGDRYAAAAAAGVDDRRATLHPLGALPGSVWPIATEPLRLPATLGVDHYAAFPTAWPRRLITGWCPAGTCTGCGQPRRPVVAGSGTGHDNNPVPDRARNGYAPAGAAFSRHRTAHPRLLLGEVCGCPDLAAPTRPAVVCDPFGGTGTTALVASALGRIGITVDLSHDYVRLARWRTGDPAQRARAAAVDPPLAGQLAMFDQPGDDASCGTEGVA